MPDEKLQSIAQNLNIGNIQRHIFLCADQTNPKCSDKQASLEAWDYLKKRLAELGLSHIYRTKANCLRVCERGPIAVVYPDGTWYHSATPPVLEKIIHQHLMQGMVVEEFAFAEAPLKADI